MQVTVAVKPQLKNYQFAQWMIQFHSINKRILEFTSKGPFNNLKQTQFNKFKTNKQTNNV